ncbi:T9SS type A sorting domain-containing protein [Hymenobacter cellulosivorans]|uniref:T9SS type A sorting domain-containing protein n=1 Tax=Hymenobacter cellulosivorans TaxID=2932249 RepID=A0ABY4F7U1_9BACT|nr:T9SS type A sorting domain-containing protein [Hymenobacter cellulosivorans]UOQ52067.1 T9SS type A sorting domain-containing protein [Hymenobacter cellulosivorans]
MPQVLPSVLFGITLLLGSPSIYQASAQAPTKQWDRSFGGSGADYLYSVQPTPDGGYILGGHSASGTSSDKSQAGKGQADYWVIKLDATGNKIWDRSFGGTGSDRLQTVRLTPDGGYLLCGYSDSGSGPDKTQAGQGDFDCWLIKIDANGNKLWDRTFGGSEADIISLLEPTNDGGFLLGGNSYSLISGDKTQTRQGGTDYWVLKVDAMGNKLWDRTFGGSGDEVLTSLLQLPDNSYLFSGYSNSGQGGDKTQPSYGGNDFWVVKTDATGTKLWDQSYGGSGLDRPQAVRLTSDGGLLLGGSSDSPASSTKTQASHGGADYWLVKTDALGNKQWDRSYGGSADDNLFTFQLAPDGSYLLSGYSQSGSGFDKTQASQGLNDFWLIQLSASGNKLWDRSFGGSGADFSFALEATKDGGYIVGGYSNSPLSGDKTQASQGDRDYWVVKLSGTTTATTPAAARQVLRTYPNPAQSELTLSLPQDFPRTGLHVSLLDATGRVVSSQNLASAGSTEVPLSIGQHPAGLYLLRLQAPNGYLATQQIVLQ